MQTNATHTDERTGTNCPFGHPECAGISGLFFGELSCFQCYRLAPKNALDVQHVTSEKARTGREHPALAGD